ncbi:MAG: hypothetical protein QXV64_01170 [Candidatus Anstonellaceae archaeon]
MLSNPFFSKLFDLKRILTEEFKKALRIIKISTKPSYREFNFLLKLSVAGILIIGTFGLIVSFLFSLLDLI